MDQSQIMVFDKGKPASIRYNRMFLFYVASYLLFAASAVRIIITCYGTPYLWYAIGLLALYLVLLSTERRISARWRYYQPVYFIIQTLVILALAMAKPVFDYYAMLFPALCVQAIWFAPPRTVVYWVTLFTVSIVVSEIALFGLPSGIMYSVTYIAAGFFISIFGIATLRAEQARAESQALLAELQVANRKLTEYASRVEELTAAQERNRLARELHDSVTQTIFSMTLTAQSTLILLDRDPGRVKEQLQHLQALSKSALAEMRSLIQQLRPRSLAEEGLVDALRRHAQERPERDGLVVDVQLLCEQDPPPRLPFDVEENLFRVIQEALNNVAKHAKTGRATVTLDLRSRPASVTIIDQGTGFDPRKMSVAPGHYGLTGMEERVRAIGARLFVDSQPGVGTRVRIENVPVKEP
ncbi:MAG: sensor histidine kinase [Chloroflexi bacterium]|nr:MAG: sensor histidine kinase [Chloroflexota bacterium]